MLWPVRWLRTVTKPDDLSSIPGSHMGKGGGGGRTDSHKLFFEFHTWALTNACKHTQTHIINVKTIFFKVVVIVQQIFP